MMPALNIGILDEVLALVKEAAPSKPKDKDQFKATQKKEIDLWHHWNTNERKPEHLKPLYESYKPLLQREANKFRTTELPSSTIHAELRKQFVNAVKSYDPKRGTQLNTWIQTNLQKSSRFVKTYQNLGKIPESQISKIREFKQAKEHLTNLQGFEPDTRTIADHLKWPHKRVVQLQKELRDDNPVSGYMHDPAEVLTPKVLEAVHLLQYDTRMSQEERTVYEYTYGLNGKSQLQPGQIAKTTGIHPSKISRIRGKLKGYVQEAMDVL
jgi:DNA-directed RNA polymerase specialized sigma subunit